MMQHQLLILIIMTASGIMGGLINYFNKQVTVEGKASPVKQELLPSLVVGVGAAYLVPLFLNMISSNLILESIKDSYKLFIFAGFCLIAAIASKSFIASLTARLLKQLRDNNEQIGKIQADLQPIAAKFTENGLESTSETLKNLSPRLEMAEVDSSERKVLKALTSDDYIFYSTRSIGKTAGLSEDSVKQLLEQLVARDLVRQSERDQGIRYNITVTGRSYLMK